MSGYINVAGLAVRQMAAEEVAMRYLGERYRIVGSRAEVAGAKSALEGHRGLKGEDPEAVEIEDCMILGELNLDHVTVGCTMSKRIVTTAINGRPGTVKEWVSDGDVVITTVAKVMGDGNSYPKEAVETILEELKKPEVLPVTNELLNDVWDVQRVVVTSIQTTNRTDRNWEEVTIGMLSDEEYLVEEQG